MRERCLLYSVLFAIIIDFVLTLYIFCSSVQATKHWWSSFKSYLNLSLPFYQLPISHLHTVSYNTPIIFCVLVKFPLSLHVDLCIHLSILVSHMLVIFMCAQTEFSVIFGKFILWCFSDPILKLQIPKIQTWTFRFILHRRTQDFFLGWGQY